MDRNNFEFQKIYTDFQPKILRYLSRLVGEGEAEDLAQEIFIKVHRSLESFRGEASLSTWIYRIATNAAIDRLRSPAHQLALRQCSTDCSGQNDEAELDDRNAWTGEKIPLVEQQLLRKDMGECFQGMVDQIPGAIRTVFVLSELEGLTDEEIAETLGITLETVKIRLHRARKKLKNALIEHCDSSWFEGNEFVPDLKKVLEAFPKIL